MAKNGDGNLHIAMLPWLAFGHIIPFLELAKLMAIKGHKISFLSTPRNIDRIPQIPKTLTSSIKFVKVDLPEVENLPESWAPQFKILNHDSVGGLLIHSGMSSVVEGFQLGKPLVLLPFMADQGTIATYLVEKKMAHMVHREEMDGSFEPESVADSLSLVMVKEEGKVYREKAKEMMALFGDRDVQDKCVDDLVHFLQNSSK